MRQNFQQNDDRRLIKFLVASILLHLLFFLYLPMIPKDAMQKEKPVELTLMNYKIADILPPEREERPDRADFLGLYDSRTEKEEVATSPPQPSQERKERQSPQNLVGEGLKKTSPQEKNLAALESYPEDFFPDYNVGDHTYLNVLRYPMVSYFVRLKKVFKTTFNPVPAIRPYYYSNQITRGQVEVVLGVEVNPNGTLKKLFVIRSSGLELYDQEALRTVHDSSPFTSPPKEFLDSDGFLRLSWTFTVSL